ncbi:ATP-binding cassette domain-containing protein [Vibrio sp. LaRot3]|uniref:ATP-binding cassette domain-containing protein n=1 Tax=Vibrio sp. LaRot3 TaxID=2998829 RepID=UPI0022CDFC6C|nr:ATP-binding cassette domain-containing protein [Vibrio sp. LaRot3]MDA0147823.1 ATP-binding cassette domain-containing protein [Vibrio sp. LaRot3]
MTLCLKNLSINKRSEEALIQDFSISVKPGEVACMMGPSGCGKSTLLNVIAGHLNKDFSYDGEVWLNEQNITKVPPHERGVGVLFQDDLLFPHLNVWQNLAFALPNDVKGNQRKQLALENLAKVNLTSLANAFPEQISGGQRARISLLRMLLAQPKVALLDEPFSKLDQSLREQFRDWVYAQLIQANIPALLVTHDRDDAPSNGTIYQWPKENQHAG